MMQSAQSRHGNDFSLGVAGYFRHAPAGRFLRQTEMRSVFVVITNVVTHETFQMPLVENDHVIQKIAAAVADKALRHAVLPGTLEGCALRFHDENLNSFEDFSAEDRIPVVDKELERSVVGKGFTQLLR